MLPLQRLIVGCQTKQVNFVVTFNDFKKAFDSIRWSALESVVAAYGIPWKLRNVVMALYYGAKAVVTTTDGEAGPFELSAGVLQGDTLAPYVFGLGYFTLSSHMDARSCTSSPAFVVSDLEFANYEDAQVLLTAVEQEVLFGDLIINCGVHASGQLQD